MPRRMLIQARATAAALLVLSWSPPGLGQTQRDFVFTEEIGHLVVRFVGIGPGGMTEAQLDEVSNQEFSSMVHDRLRADLLFEAEPAAPDQAWAAAMTARLEAHIRQSGIALTAISSECRTGSCRLIVHRPESLSVHDHRTLLDDVQSSVERFRDAHQDEFLAEYMLTAYEKQFAIPHVKIFLRRPTYRPRLIRQDG